MEKTPIRDEIWDMVTRMRTAGMDNEKIAKITGISHLSLIYHFFQIDHPTATLSKINRSSKSFSSRAERSLVRYARSHPWESYEDLAKAKLCGGEEISSTTVAEILQRNGFGPFTSSIKSRLTEAQLKTRLKFAKDYLRWTVDDWKNVMFSGEIMFDVGDPRGPVHYLVRKDFDFSQMIEPPKKGRKSVLIWIAISGHGRTPLYLYDLPEVLPYPPEGKKKNPGFTATVYLETLEANLLPAMAGKDLKFQQDNNPIHTAKQVRKWLDKQSFETLVWPAKSADINPVQNILIYMKHQLKSRYPSLETIEEIKAELTTMWNDVIDDDFVDSYFQKMPQKMADLVKCKGEQMAW